MKKKPQRNAPGAQLCAARLRSPLSRRTPQLGDADVLTPLPAKSAGGHSAGKTRWEHAITGWTARRGEPLAERNLQRCLFAGTNPQHREADDVPFAVDFLHHLIIQKQESGVRSRPSQRKRETGSEEPGDLYA